ncbi:MAG: MFS transporter [Burkholderiales bacterium]|nr:MFS transporter [Burkholderiales bacterium]
MSAGAGELRRDTEVIGLVGFAHLFSHFLQLILAPLFPLLKDEFGVGYAALGLMVSVMYTVSGISQTMAGFIVDRYGARRVLLFGMATFSLALLLTGLATSYWMLVAIAVLAGIGNSVFHPADFAILNAKVNPKRLGYAFSTHGIGGNFGWLAAPVFSIGISTAYGWRAAVISAGVLGLLITAVIASRAVLADAQSDAAGQRSKAQRAGASGLKDDVRGLLSAPVLKCFAFFTFHSMALIGLQTFSVSVTTALYGAPLVTASAALTGFLFGGIVGMVAGGFVAARSTRHNLVAAAGMLTGAALTLLLASGALPLWFLTGNMTLIGFFIFSTQPSRDILVRGATPPGATGKVYGFVYSGLDLGASLSPLLFGWMLDQHLPQWVFGSAAVFMLFAVATVVTLRPRGAAIAEPGPGAVPEEAPS